MTPQEAVRFRRSALEGIAAILRTEPNIYVPYQRLPGGTLWSAHVIIAQLEILEHEGRIELSKTFDPTEWASRITPLGRLSLEVSEEEWNMSTNQPSTRTPRTSPAPRRQRRTGQRVAWDNDQSIDNLQRPEERS